MKKYRIFSLALAFLVVLDSCSQITYHDINPDTTVNSWDAFTIAPSDVSTNYFVLWWHPQPEVIVETNGNCELLFDGANMLPSKLTNGDNISSTGTWSSTTNSALNSLGTGNWQINAIDRYIGFRVKRTSGNWFYGWLKMSVESGALSFTVKEWAINSLSDQSIMAGQTNINATELSSKIDQIPIMKVQENELYFDNLEDGAFYDIDIIAMSGQRIQFNRLTSSGSIDLGGLTKGIYTLQLRGINYSGVYKLIVR